MDTAITAAIIAAAASIVAALVAWRQARIAADAAQRIAATNHRVARLDTEAAQLRDDYRRFLDAVGHVREVPDVGPMLTAGKVLDANPRATDALRNAADQIERRMISFVAAVSAGASTVPESPDNAFSDAQQAIGDALQQIADERAAVLAEGGRKRRRAIDPA